MNLVLKNFNEKLKNLRKIKNFRWEVSILKFAKKINKICFFERDVFFKSKVVSFASNNYLSLSNDKKVIKAGINALKKFGAGAGASKFIEGYNFYYTKIEEKIKDFKRVEDCTIFTSGYSANLAIFESLASKNDIIFLDEFSHASSFEGAKLSGAKIMRYKHNQASDLESKLQKFAEKAEKIFIVTETVFSMKGSVLREPESYVSLAKKYNAILVIDEAHSFGILEFSFPSYEMMIQIGTFSKAVGALGGYVCGNKILIETVRQFGKSGIYTTALPPSVLACVLKSLELISTKKITGEKALMNAKFFESLTGIKTESQIVFVECASNEQALKIEEEIKNAGFFVKAIRRPTVPNPGIRISFNNSHKKVDIKKLSFIIRKLFNENL